ncbi:MAG: hypothetical protein VB108_01290 [Anaerolineaceae bacterium]|nr:hypothetical protein [Anaerolineaceae bacterium]
MNTWRIYVDWNAKYIASIWHWEKHDQNRIPISSHWTLLMKDVSEAYCREFVHTSIFEAISEHVIKINELRS